MGYAPVLKFLMVVVVTLVLVAVAADLVVVVVVVIMVVVVVVDYEDPGVFFEITLFSTRLFSCCGSENDYFQLERIICFKKFNF